MIRTCGLWLLTFWGLTLTVGCSWVSLGYNRLPDISRVWLDRQLHLNATQTEALNQDLQAILQWHRQQQLPVIADTLYRWQGLIAQDKLSAEQWCQEMTTVRDWLQTLGLQTVPAAVRLAQRLEPAQYAHLQSAQQKSHAEFRKLWLEPPPRSNWRPNAQASPSSNRETLAEAQLKRLQSRYEQLYGSLNAAQLEALRVSIQSSRFDPQLALRERERRTQDLVQTLQAIQALPTTPQNDRMAKTLAQGWLDRLHNSPNPEYTRAARGWQEDACIQMAQLHQLSTPMQRQHARDILRDYERQAKQQFNR